VEGVLSFYGRLMGLTKLVIRGARQHNLKNISVEIPRNSLTVITGLSGSGKSSLAFDTIYAEGQRRYVESLSAYARQFLDQMERPEVDVIEGLFSLDCHRAKNHHTLAALHGRHHHGNLRLSSSDLRHGWGPALPELRFNPHAPVQRANRPVHSARRNLQAGRPHYDSRAHRSRGGRARFAKSSKNSRKTATSACASTASFSSLMNFR